MTCSIKCPIKMLENIFYWAKTKMKASLSVKTGRCRKHRGFSLLDVIIASVVLLIAIVGTCSYRYHSKIDQRKAKLQTSAARIAELLYENWRGASGASTYNPTAYTWPDMTISASSGPTTPTGFTKLNSYAIATNNFNYNATLSWQNISGSTGLRALNATVEWSTSGSETADSSFSLTSYCLY
jgi:Tfp pilus assembly protein PilV